jgi:hypothetical protein
MKWLQMSLRNALNMSNLSLTRNMWAMLMSLTLITELVRLMLLLLLDKISSRTSEKKMKEENPSTPI